MISHIEWPCFRTKYAFLVKKKYPWKNLFSKIKNYIQGCKTCNKQGLPIIKTISTIFTTTFVNEMWEADLIRSLKGSEGRYFSYW